MKADQFHPELQKAIKLFPALPFHNRAFLWFANLVMKGLPKATTSEELIIEEQKLINAYVRIYKPKSNLAGAGLLWIHGGGLVAGNTALNDRECMAYARDLKLIIVSVEYRLAPRHPFPAAIDDCFEAWLWMQQNAKELGMDPARVVVSGISAGGGLAASLAQKILDEKGMQPAGQALFSPMLDDRTALQYDLDSLNHPVWNNKSNRAAWAWYLGQPVGETFVPAYAVPSRREDLSGLPEAWIAIGEVELFFEEAVRYADRLNSADVGCALYVTPMASHGFESILPKANLTRNLFKENYRFLRRVLAL